MNMPPRRANIGGVACPDCSPESPHGYIEEDGFKQEKSRRYCRGKKFR